MTFIFSSPTATTFAELDPGDSILKSTTLLACSREICSLVVKGIQSYNRANPNLLVPTASLSDDADARQMSFSVQVPYVQVETAPGSGIVVNKANNNIGAYTSWTVPTTGYFAGVESLLDALVKIVDYVTYVAQQLEPTALYNSPVGFYTLEDNKTNNEYAISINTGVNAIVDSVTGVTQIVVDEWTRIIDYQQGLV
jgi:hypothetical protein